MKRRSPTAALTAAFVLSWSSGWIIAQIGVADLGLFFLLAARYAVVTFVLGIVLLVRRSWQPMSLRDCVPYFLVGVLSHAAYLIFGIGAFSLGVGAGLVAFVTALQPMIIAMFTAPLTQDRVNLRQWSGLALGLVAVLMVISEKMHIGFTVTALILPIVSVLALSLGMLLQRNIAAREAATGRRSPPLTQALFLHVSAAFAVLLLCMPLSGESLPALNMRMFAIVAWLAIVVSLGAYAIMALLLMRMSAFKVVSLTYLTPPATMLMAWIVFGQQVGAIDWVGLAVAAVGVSMTLYRPRKRVRRRARSRHTRTLTRRTQPDIEC